MSMYRPILSSILFHSERLSNGNLSGHVRNELLDAYGREGDPFPDRTDEEIRWLGENLIKVGEYRALAAACIGRAAKVRGLTDELRPVFERWTVAEPKVLPAFDECKVNRLPPRVDEETLHFNLGRYWATNW